MQQRGSAQFMFHTLWPYFPDKVLPAVKLTGPTKANSLRDNPGSLTDGDDEDATFARIDRSPLTRVQQR